jgi:hypothetical protein
MKFHLNRFWQEFSPAVNQDYLKFQREQTRRRHLPNAAASA